MSFEIENDVPIPENASPSGPGRALKYPLDQLSVGQSFKVPVPDNPDPEVFEAEMRRTASRMSNAANRYRKTRDPDFYALVRREEGGVRLWRIEPKGSKAKEPQKASEPESETEE